MICILFFSFDVSICMLKHSSSIFIEFTTPSQFPYSLHFITDIQFLYSLPFITVFSGSEELTSMRLKNSILLFYCDLLRS